MNKKFDINSILIENSFQDQFIEQQKQEQRLINPALFYSAIAASLIKKKLIQPLETKEKPRPTLAELQLLFGFGSMLNFLKI